MRIKFFIYLLGLLGVIYYGIVKPFNFSEEMYRKYVGEQLVLLRASDPSAVSDISDPAFQELVVEGEKKANNAFKYYFSCTIAVISLVFFMFSFFYRGVKSYDVLYFYWPMIFSLLFFPNGFISLLPLFFWGLGIRLSNKINKRKK